jgi:hypothetical protein
VVLALDGAREIRRYCPNSLSSSSPFPLLLADPAKRKGGALSKNLKATMDPLPGPVNTVKGGVPWPIPLKSVIGFVVRYPGLLN